MQAVLNNFAQGMDGLRASVLRVTLSLPGFVEIFRSRAWRLFFLFWIHTVVALMLSLFFPLYVLAIGPILYGVPHLFASVRYVHLSSAQPQQQGKRVFTFFAGIFGLITIYRIFTDLIWMSSVAPFEVELFPEYLSALVTFAGLCFFYRSQSGKLLQGALVLGPFLYFAWNVPTWTAGAMVLLHNLIAFIYWIIAARKRSELLTAGVATLVFLSGNALIFSGLLNELMLLWGVSGTLPWADLDYLQLGNLIAPWAGESRGEWFLYHCVVAYAFGQSMHYFVWLKAIPDQHHSSEAPTSFRQSLKLMQSDFGRRGLYFIIGLLLVSVAAWAFLSFEQARILYFALAAYHGYLELAGLGVARFKLETA